MREVNTVGGTRIFMVKKGEKFTCPIPSIPDSRGVGWITRDAEKDYITVHLGNRDQAAGGFICDIREIEKLIKEAKKCAR